MGDTAMHFFSLFRLISLATPSKAKVETVTKTLRQKYKRSLNPHNITQHGSVDKCHDSCDDPKHMIRPYEVELFIK